MSSAVKFLKQTFIFGQQMVERWGDSPAWNQRLSHRYFHPFSKSIPTLGSYAYSLMRAYPMANQDIRGIQDEFGKISVKVSHFEFRYVSYLESLYEDLEHSFNNMRRQKFKKSIPDAYSPIARKLFYANGCQVHGHFVFVGAANAPNSAPSTSTTAQTPITGYMKPCPYLALETTGSDCNFY